MTEPAWRDRPTISDVLQYIPLIRAIPLYFLDVYAFLVKYYTVLTCSARFELVENELDSLLQLPEEVRALPSM